MTQTNRYSDLVEKQRQLYLDQKVPVNISLIEQDGEWCWVASVIENPEFQLFVNETQQEVIELCEEYELPFEI
ncbi:hypothetical protein [Brevibacillus sp. IT-7CA2]|uniref:hypothetical protein n=1 Tax=Brevibacillus sp. IT-7CA2 TaxID=3026436 RepID=UPI0039E03266